MNSQKSVQKYDHFKLIVALILLVLFIILLLTLRGVSPANQQVSAEQQNAAGVPSETAVKVEMAASTPTPTPVPVTSTPTATLPPTATATLPAPSPTPTLPPAPTATPAPTSADTTPTVEPTTAPESATPTPKQANTQGDCSAAIVSRLAIGDKARVISNLNLRSSPDLASNNLVKVNPVGTQLEIISGPTCTVYGGGAYLWWQVRMSDGQTGWSAEGSLEGKNYFLEPVK